jgi:hypothetical protein
VSPSLQQFIDELESHRRRIVVVNGTAVDEQIGDIVDYFDRFDLETEHVSASALPDAFLVLTDGDDYLGSIGVAELHEYLYDSFAGDVDPDPDVEMGRSPAVEGFLSRLDGNVYSLSAEGKLALACVSHLLETRAWRRGLGELHAGIQRFSLLRDDPALWSRYRKLAACGVETSVYGQSDWTPADWHGVTAYADESGACLGDYWFVAYRGPEERDDGALLAREDDDGRYTGFWTFDSDTVDAIVDTLVGDHQSTLTRLPDGPS